MKSPLVILGPTSSGKTALSFFLAKELPNVDILVVDSKQVYKEQDIVTGKDIPEDSAVPIYGTDLVKPDEDWSVAQFLQYAKEVIERSKREDRFLIIVGGTPQYLISLFGEPETAAIPPNQILRDELEKLSVDQLQSRVDTKRLSQMNDSDRKNPRRLIRAIEVQDSSIPHTYKIHDGILKKEECCWIGLSVQTEKLEPRIRQRVIDRFQQGALAEYDRLFLSYMDWTKEAKSAIGYKEIEAFFSGKIGSEKELIDLWTLHEVQYAKRQMTWWKRGEQIQWFDALSPSLQTDVLGFVKNCYNE